MELIKVVLNVNPEDKPSLRLVEICERWMNETDIPEDFYVTKMTEK